jgi:hypothetical protein
LDEHIRRPPFVVTVSLFSLVDNLFTFCKIIMIGTGQDELSNWGNIVDIENSVVGNFSVNSAITVTDNNNVHDNQFSADATYSNPHVEGSNGWFGGMKTDFRNIAHCLTDNVAPVVSGVASIVHRTAVAVVNELAQLEQACETECMGRVDHGNNLESHKSNPSVLSTKTESKTQSLMLPWEVMKLTTNGDDDRIPVYLTDDMLMEDILSLSSKESTFLKPFQAEFDNGKSSIEEPNDLKDFSSTFEMDQSRIKLIRRLIDIDQSLASMHSRFSGKHF